MIPSSTSNQRQEDAEITMLSSSLHGSRKNNGVSSLGLQCFDWGNCHGAKAALPKKPMIHNPSYNWSVHKAIEEAPEFYNWTEHRRRNTEMDMSMPETTQRRMDPTFKKSASMRDIHAKFGARARQARKNLLKKPPRLQDRSVSAPEPQQERGRGPAKPIFSAPTNDRRGQLTTGRSRRSLVGRGRNDPTLRMSQRGFTGLDRSRSRSTSRTRSTTDESGSLSPVRDSSRSRRQRASSRSPVPDSSKTRGRRQRNESLSSSSTRRGKSQSRSLKDSSKSRNNRDSLRDSSKSRNNRDSLRDSSKSRRGSKRGLRDASIKSRGRKDGSLRDSSRSTMQQRDRSRSRSSSVQGRRGQTRRGRDVVREEQRKRLGQLTALPSLTSMASNEDEELQPDDTPTNAFANLVDDSVVPETESSKSPKNKDNKANTAVGIGKAFMELLDVSSATETANQAASMATERLTHLGGQAIGATKALKQLVQIPATSAKNVVKDTLRQSTSSAHSSRSFGGWGADSSREHPEFSVDDEEDIDPLDISIQSAPSRSTLFTS